MVGKNYKAYLKTKAIESAERLQKPSVIKTKIKKEKKSGMNNKLTVFFR